MTMTDKKMVMIITKQKTRPIRGTETNLKQQTERIKITKVYITADIVINTGNTNMNSMCSNLKGHSHTIWDKKLMFDIRVEY